MENLHSKLTNSQFNLAHNLKS